LIFRDREKAATRLLRRVIFLSDVLSGDAVVRWMAVGYCMAAAMATSFLVAIRRDLRS
jgi:hypothetical protein